jgi:hypothetical protein
VDWRGALHNNALVKLPQAMLLETEEPRSHAQVPRHASLSLLAIVSVDWRGGLHDYGLVEFPQDAENHANKKWPCRSRATF